MFGRMPQTSHSLDEFDTIDGMKLIFIYGPPAVGKLTVGLALAKATGYRLFHNHLTVLVARSIFPGHHELHPEKIYSKLLKKMRIDGISAAAEADVSIIFTLAYSGEADDVFVDKLVEIVKKHDGHVHFVQLEAPEGVLLERVSNQSRKDIAKLTDPQRLREILATRDIHAAVKHRNVLKIDTSKLSAIQAAQQTVQHFKLKK
jgi:shikimate kinase